jgi:hypothetical protein
MKKAYLLPLLVLFLWSCDKNGNCIDPNEKSMQTFYSPGAFDNIVLKGDADLVIREDSLGFYWGTGSDNILPLWEVLVENNTLFIEPLANTCFNSSDAVFYINHPNIEVLRIEGTSLVHMIGMDQEDMLVNVVGYSNIRIDSSSFDRLDVLFQGTGNLYAFDNPCDTVEVNISGKADVEVTVSDLLQVIIYGEGVIRYDGTPIIEQQITGSGSINPR